MNKSKYHEEHHHITESYLGLVRVYLDKGDLEMAKYYADECSKKLGELLKQLVNSWGIQDD